MTTATHNKKYKYNVKFDIKEEWYMPDVWTSVQTRYARFDAFPYNDDDVIVCTYPRSGTHMTWLLVRYLLQGSTNPIKDSMEDAHLPPLHADSKQEKKRVLNTHLYPAHFGDEFIMKGKHKFIHVTRNPKDVMVSYFNLLKTMTKFRTGIPDNWEDFLVFSLTTNHHRFNWFNHMKAWEEFMDKNPRAPILDLKFEDIVRDPKTAITEMANFMEVTVSESFLQDLLIACKFENMKDAPVSDVMRKTRALDPGKFTCYKQGKIGDWVNTFSVAQNEQFDTVYREQMKDSKVKVIYH